MHKEALLLEGRCRLSAAELGEPFQHPAPGAFEPRIRKPLRYFASLDRDRLPSRFIRLIRPCDLRETFTLQDTLLLCLLGRSRVGRAAAAVSDLRLPSPGPRYEPFGGRRSHLAIRTVRTAPSWVRFANSKNIIRTSKGGAAKISTSLRRNPGKPPGIEIFSTSLQGTLA